jgi:hypothetical protein
MPEELRVPRRTLLTAVGAVGAASLGAGTYAGFVDRAGTHARFTAGEVDLRVHYTRRADGAEEEGVVGNGEPIALSASTLRPGDSGSLAVEFGLTDDPAFVRLCPTLDVTDGGTDGPGADLWEALHVTLAYTNDGGEVVERIVTGSLADVAAALDGGLALDSTGRQRAPGAQASFEPTGEETAPVGLHLSWQLPADAGSAVSGDSVALSLRFVARQARHTDGTNPPCEPDGTPTPEPEPEPAPERTAISFLAFCHEGASAPEVTFSEFVYGADDENEVVGLRWTSTAPVTTVVLEMERDGAAGGTDSIETHPAGGATTGTVLTGEGDRADPDQSPNDPCSGGHDVTKYEWNDETGGFDRER